MDSPVDQRRNGNFAVLYYPANKVIRVVCMLSFFSYVIRLTYKPLTGSSTAVRVLKSVVFSGAFCKLLRGD